MGRHEPGHLTRADSATLAKDLGADSLRYLTVGRLVDASGAGKNELCLGCLTGEYPTRWGDKNYQAALQEKDRPQTGRTYERALTPNT